MWSTVEWTQGVPLISGQAKALPCHNLCNGMLMCPTNHARFDSYAFFIFYFQIGVQFVFDLGQVFTVNIFASLCLSTTLVLSTFSNSVVKLSPLISRIDMHLPFPIHNPWDVCLWISPLSICYSNYPQWHAAFIKMSCICHRFNNLLLEHQAHITWTLHSGRKDPVWHYWITS